MILSAWGNRGVVWRLGASGPTFVILPILQSCPIYLRTDRFKFSLRGVPHRTPRVAA